MTDALPPDNGGHDKLLPINIEDEMRQSYLDYAMSVIIGRALPDVRDGLKPVHRRALFAMHELSNSYNRPYKKSARVVGDTIGKFHPHGDQAVYDTIVRLAQEFSMRHVLVDGQGNFGSIDGDPPAAMRYTEVRMSKLAGELLADLEKETVDFGPNYDDSLTEPLVMPTRFPNLLINGGSGIAVGMATNIPPHNLAEVIDGTIALARNAQVSTRELMKLIPGPDFPTGGIVYGTGEMLKAYETGRGSLKVRGRAHVEESGKHNRIIITELPFQVNKAALLEKIAELVSEKRLEGISDIRDESAREGMRVVIDLKRDAVGDIVLNQLYANTTLQTSFGINMLAIINGQPRIMGLREILQAFIDHRKEVVTRRSRFELREAQKRFNVVFGLLAAIDSIDRVIEIIRAAKDQDAARLNLMSEKLPVSPAFRKLCEGLLTFDYEPGTAALTQGFVRLNEAQAQAILEMRLARLTGLERDKLAQEGEELRDIIKRLLAILASDEQLLEVIIEELEIIKKEYADKRRTELVLERVEMSVEDLIADEEMVVTVSHMGYVKRSSLDLYRAQKRGGRGKTAATTRDEDFVESIFVASTHAYVLCFTDKGKVYWLKVHEIPEAGRATRGKPIVNLIRIDKDEKVCAVLPVREFVDGKFLVMCTKDGVIKKTDLMAFSNPRPSGLIATTIDEGDALMDVGLTDGKNEILLATRQGMAIRFAEDEVRAMGRAARGVRGIDLKKEGDGVVAMVILDPNRPHILTVCDHGYGKRSEVEEYRLQGRGGSGIINLKVSDKTGPVGGVVAVGDGDQVMVVTNRGMMIRTRVKQISVMGRSAQGVRVISIEEGEMVANIARVAEADDEEVDSGDEGPTPDAAPAAGDAGDEPKVD